MDGQYQHSLFAKFPRNMLTDWWELDNGMAKIAHSSPCSGNGSEPAKNVIYWSWLYWFLETPWSRFYFWFWFPFCGTFRVPALCRGAFARICIAVLSAIHFSSPLSLFPLTRNGRSLSIPGEVVVYDKKGRRRMGDVSAPQHSLIRPPVANEGKTRRNNHNRSNQ